jgi:putative ABC transport system substrate-binding protein
MRRRAFIALLGGAAAAWPLAARAQQGDRMRIGVFMPLAEDDPVGQARIAAFLQGLQHTGWTDGGNVRIDYRWSAGDDERVRKYAAELVALAPDVILATGSATVGALLQATRTIPIVFPIAVDPVGAGFVESLARPGGNATGSATRTIPIVFVNVTDPVGAGLVDSLAQPGSNITGFTLFEYGLSAKWLELLKAATDRIDGVCDVTAELLLAFRRRPFFAFGG